MAVDKTKLAFGTTNEIDHILTTGTVDVGVGTTAIYTFSSVGLPPVFEVQFRGSGSIQWQSAGIYREGVTLYNTHAYIQVTTIYFTTDRAGTARYFVWSDTVNQ